MHFVSDLFSVLVLCYLFTKFILDASQYAQYVFNTIKRNQTGKISFEVISFV